MEIVYRLMSAKDTLQTLAADTWNLVQRIIKLQFWYFRILSNTLLVSYTIITCNCHLKSFEYLHTSTLSASLLEDTCKRIKRNTPIYTCINDLTKILLYGVYYIFNLVWFGVYNLKFGQPWIFSE